MLIKLLYKAHVYSNTNKKQLNYIYLYLYIIITHHEIY